MQNVMAAAWSAYRIARPARWAAGDETGKRRFLPDLFRNILRQAWADLRKARALENSREADRLAARLRDSIRASKVDLAASMAPEGRAERIREILTDLEMLAYEPFHVRTGERGAYLREELEILKEACGGAEPLPTRRAEGALAITLAQVA